MTDPKRVRELVAQVKKREVAERELFALLEKERDMLLTLKEEIRIRTQNRDEMILLLWYQMGYSPTEVARLAGVTMPYLYQIRDRDVPKTPTKDA